MSYMDTLNDNSFCLNKIGDHQNNISSAYDHWSALYTDAKRIFTSYVSMVLDNEGQPSHCRRTNVISEGVLTLFYERNKVASLTIPDVIHSGVEEKINKNYLSDLLSTSPYYRKCCLWSNSRADSCRPSSCLE